MLELQLGLLDRAPAIRSEAVQLAPVPLSSWPLGPRPEFDELGPELSPPLSSPGSSLWSP